MASSACGTLRPSILAVGTFDDELEPGRLHDRQIRWLRALENAACVDADVAIRIHQTCAVAHQSADFGMMTVLAMNMSVTQFVQAPAIVARSRSVWHEIIGTVIEDRERLRTKSTSILHSISTIYHRRCGLSLSGVTFAYSAD